MLSFLSVYDRNFCESEPNHSRSNPEAIPRQSRANPEAHALLTILIPLLN